VTNPRPGDEGSETAAAKWRRLVRPRATRSSFATMATSAAGSLRSSMRSGNDMGRHRRLIIYIVG